MAQVLTPPTILDIEASGFGKLSYPIEVGVARSDGARFCRLIKPSIDWQHWDEEAQALHGISRHELFSHGLECRDVCSQLNAFLGHNTAYSDGWVVDYPWLIKLYAAANMAMSFRLSALEYLLNEQQMARWHSVKQDLLDQQPVHRHRASVDAEIIQQTFLRSEHSSNSLQASSFGQIF